MRDTSPESVNKRATIWMDIEPDLEKFCRTKWPDTWEDILSEGMCHFLRSHDLDRDCSRTGIISFAKNKCLMGAREEARQHGLPQSQFRKSKPESENDTNSESENVKKKAFKAPILLSFEGLAESSGFDIGEDNSDKDEKRILVKSLLLPALQNTKNREQFTAALNMVFDGDDFAEAARACGLEPSRFSEWLAKIGYANGRPLPPTKATASRKVATRKVVQVAPVATDVVAQIPQLPVSQVQIQPPEPFLGFTEYAQKQMELFDSAAIQVVEKQPKARNRRKASSAMADQLSFDFDSIVMEAETFEKPVVVNQNPDGIVVVPASAVFSMPALPILPYTYMYKPSSPAREETFTSHRVFCIDSTQPRRAPRPFEHQCRGYG